MGVIWSVPHGSPSGVTDRLEQLRDDAAHWRALVAELRGKAADAARHRTRAAALARAGTHSHCGLVGKHIKVFSLCEQADARGVRRRPEEELRTLRADRGRPPGADLVCAWVAPPPGKGGGWKGPAPGLSTAPVRGTHPALLRCSAAVVGRACVGVISLRWRLDWNARLVTKPKVPKTSTWCNIRDTTLRC